jgi:hypothetical protein
MSTDTTWRPDLERMTKRVAERLRDDGHAYPELAAQLLAERGHARLDRAALAWEVGLTQREVAAAEDGESERLARALLHRQKGGTTVHR